VNARVLDLAEQIRDLVIVEKFSDNIIRFTPKAWNVPGNRGFRNFNGNDRHVLLELKLHPTLTCFNVCSGRSPKPWIDEVWKMAAKAPFSDREEWYPEWFCLHRVTNGKLSFADDDLTDPNEMADAAFAWLKETLKRKDTQAVIEQIAQKLKNLPAGGGTAS
jgi:hypothetical protein